MSARAVRIRVSTFPTWESLKGQAADTDATYPAQGGAIRFPRSIRELGILYVCDEVVEASAGGSYVATGEIKRLIQ